MNTNSKVIIPIKTRYSKESVSGKEYHLVYYLSFFSNCYEVSCYDVDQITKNVANNKPTYSIFSQNILPGLCDPAYRGQFNYNYVYDNLYLDEVKWKEVTRNGRTYSYPNFKFKIRVY